MYEEWYQKLEPLRKELMKCPVCKGKLGYRNNHNSVFVEHCDECLATYTFGPSKDIPTVMLDSDPRIHSHCDCGRCN